MERYDFLQALTDFVASMSAVAKYTFEAINPPRFRM
jgi:hypothetical protein